MMKRLLTIILLLPALAGGLAVAGIPELDGLVEQRLDINVVPEKLPETLPITTSSSLARAHFRQARQKQWNFDIDGAIRFYRKSLQHDPEFVRAHLQLSLLNVPNANWHRIRANANLYLLPRGERQFVKSLLKNKLRADPLAELAETYPNDAEVLLYLGRTLAQSGQFPAARDAYLTAVKKYPVSALAWQNLGNQYLALKDHYRAYIAFEKEKSLIPDRAQAYLALGGFYLKTWKYEKAMRMAENVIRIDPGLWQGYVLLANALTLSGDSGVAQEVLASRLDTESDSVQRIEYLIALVDSLIDDGNFPKAIKHLSQLYHDTSISDQGSPLSERQVRGGDIYFLNRLGDTYLEYGDYGSAQDVYDNILRICEESQEDKRGLAKIESTYLFNTARVALVRKNVRKAQQLIVTLSRTISQNDDLNIEQKIAQLQGEIHLASGDPDEAIRFLKKIDANNPYLLNLLATAYMRAGKEALAHQYYKKAIEYSSFDQYEYAFVRHKARRALRESEPVVVNQE
jgi:tetratricopeptide (TPR) repeat protein